MRCRSGSYLSTSQFGARTRGNVRKEVKIQKDSKTHCKVRLLTCGVNANILSCKEYSLLVLRIPTSLDLRPDKPSFLLRPEKKIKSIHKRKNKNLTIIFIRYLNYSSSISVCNFIELYLNMYTDG